MESVIEHIAPGTRVILERVTGDMLVDPDGPLIHIHVTHLVEAGDGYLLTGKRGGIPGNTLCVWVSEEGYVVTPTGEDWVIHTVAD